MWPDCAHDPTGLALLQGAKEHPLETDRRLILADWLEDMGEGEVAGCVRESLQEPVHWVGFTEPVAARWHPWNGCRLGWPGLRGPFTDLPDSPWLCALSRGAGDIGPADIPALAAVPSLTHLVHLSLVQCSIDDATLPSLLVSPYLTGLTALVLSRNRIGAGASALAHAHHLARLTLLNLEENAIGPHDAITLVMAPALRNLTSLNLRNNAIGSPGIQALAQTLSLPALTALDLGVNDVTDGGAIALATAPALAGLTPLDLANNHISSVGARALVASPHLSRLAYLNLAGNRIGDSGAEALEGLQSRGVRVLW
jgi:hypothetical protein